MAPAPLPVIGIEAPLHNKNHFSKQLSLFQYIIITIIIIFINVSKLLKTHI